MSSEEVAEAALPREPFFLLNFSTNTVPAAKKAQEVYCKREELSRVTLLAERKNLQNLF